MLNATSSNVIGYVLLSRDFTIIGLWVNLFWQPYDEASLAYICYHYWWLPQLASLSDLE